MTWSRILPERRNDSINYTNSSKLFYLLGPNGGRLGSGLLNFPSF